MTRCTTCPRVLTQTEVGHGLRRCRKCRLCDPGRPQTKEVARAKVQMSRDKQHIALTPKHKPSVTVNGVSWWVGADRATFAKAALDKFPGSPPQIALRHFGFGHQV